MAVGWLAGGWWLVVNSRSSDPETKEDTCVQHTTKAIHIFLFHAAAARQIGWAYINNDSIGSLPSNERSVK
ncbi:hypothetical protein GQ54DRAFT_220629 [Martensiomyces pterosporus]|nr:hypothetical protein GQ54DRAFT_220629 [Martensiomyces pterosporus]